MAGSWAYSVLGGTCWLIVCCCVLSTHQFAIKTDTQLATSQRDNTAIPDQVAMVCWYVWLHIFTQRRGQTTSLELLRRPTIKQYSSFKHSWIYMSYYGINIKRRETSTQRPSRFDTSKHIKRRNNTFTRRG